MSQKALQTSLLEILTRANDGGRGGPIGGDEIDAPEMRRGREELEAYALAFFRRITQKHDAAFLLFLRKWVGDDENRVHAERLIQAEHTAVRVDHNRLAGLAETAAIGVFPRDDHAHTHEDPGTASNLVGIRFRHDYPMLRHIYFPVNETIKGVFPPCNLGAGARPLTADPCFHVPGSALRAMIPQVIQSLVRQTRGSSS